MTGPGQMPDMSNMNEMMNNPMVKEMMKMAQQMMQNMGGGTSAQNP